MTAVVYDREARAELDAAVAYYEGRQAGLGMSVLAEVESTLARAQRNPKHYPPYKTTGCRKIVLPRFPYNVYYLETADGIWVAAVAHHKRKPDYWMTRHPAD